MAPNSGLLRLAGMAYAMMLMIFFLSSTVVAAPVSELVSSAKVLVGRGIVSPSNAELLHNTIGFGTVGLIAFGMRLISRVWVLRSWKNDDTMMCVTIFFYISLLVLINVSAHYATNLYPPEQAASIFADPSDVANRIIGSKIVIALEQCMMATTWGVKFCIWYFVLRANKLTQWENSLWYLFGYLWVSFITIEIVYYGVVCRPFHQYWAMPVSNAQCATYHTYSIVQMVFNISSDLWLILAPMPLVRSARLPLKRKIVLVCMFSLAGVTIIAAILNKVYNFASPQTTAYQLWYIRESSVAVTVGNLICSWQLLQKIFKLRSFDDKQAGIQPLAHIHGPHLGQAGQQIGQAAAQGGAQIRSGFGAMKRKVRGLYSITDIDASLLERTQKSEKTADSTVTGGTFIENSEAGNERTGTADSDESKTITGTIETEVSDELAKQKRRWNFGARNKGRKAELSMPSQLMTVARDGDDAGPALAYRDEHDIV